jgi:hypothetical protein
VKATHTWRDPQRGHFNRLSSIVSPFPARFDHTIGPFSGGLPKKISVGETFSSYFPRQVDWFEHKRFRIGFSDSFGGNHWCNKRDVEKIVAKEREAA